MGSEIIQRDEAEEIRELKGWVLIYGRRKVGKTFLIKNFLEHDVFFRVNRDGSVSAEKFAISRINNADELLRAVRELLSNGKTIAIDEFQRLPESILEGISTVHPKGRLILSGSSMRVVKRMFGSKSPLLGLGMQYRLGLVKPANILRELSKKMEAQKAVELAPYLADVWTIPFVRNGGDSTKEIYELLKYSKFTVPALVGEIFTEEERGYTRVYEAILRLLGAGEWDYKKIASILAERKLIGKADSSLVLPYIKNMAAMGLVDAIPVYSSKKKMYRLSSPIMEAFFYLADRYGFEERDVSLEEAKPTIDKLKSFAIQNFVGELFASSYNGQKEYYVTPSNELDFIITVRNKPVVVGEVRWGRYDGRDVKKFLEKSSFIEAERVFVTKKKKEEYASGVRIMDAKDLVDMAKKSERK